MLSPDSRWSTGGSTASILTLASNSSSRRGTATLHVVLLAFACTLVLFLLSSVSVIGTSSEAREAHIVRVMVGTGDWILPTRNGLLPSKPPLHHWLAAGAGLMVGRVSEVVARLPSVLAGGLILLLTGLLALDLAQRAGSASVLGGGSGSERGPAVFAIFSMLILEPRTASPTWGRTRASI